MVNVWLDSIGQVDSEYAVSKLVYQIERPWAVDLVVRRVVTQSEDSGIQPLQSESHQIGCRSGHDILQREHYSGRSRNVSQGPARRQSPAQPLVNFLSLEVERPNMRHNAGCAKFSRSNRRLRSLLNRLVSVQSPRVNCVDCEAEVG